MGTDTENVPWPLLLALGRCCPYLSLGGWVTVLNFLAQSKEGRAVARSVCLSVCLYASCGGEHHAGSQASATKLPPILRSIAICHPSAGQGPRLSSSLSTALACGKCLGNIC